MTKRRRSTRAPKPVEKSDEVLEEADDGNQDPTSEEAAEMSPEQDVEGETNDDVTETAKEPDADTAEKLPDSDKKEQPPTKDEVAVSEPVITTEAAAVESSKIVDDNSSDKSVDKPDVVAAASTEKSEENAIANTASDGKEEQKDSSDCSKETAQVDKSGPAGENTQQVDKPPEIDLTISDDEDEPMEVESTSTKPLSSTIDLSTAPDSPDVSVIQTPSTQSAGGVGDNVKKDDVQMDGGDSPEIEYAVLSEEREKTPEEEAAEKAKAEAEEAAAKVKAEEEAAAARAKAEAEEAAAKAKAEKEAAAAKLKAEQEAAAAKAKAERRKLLQEMAEAKINYDDDEESIPIDPEFDHEDDEEPSESEGFKRYWRTVTDSPQDFTAWTYLLQLVEQEGKLRLARRAYNNFFKRYPLCYGYWKKFSEVERKKGNMLRARKILERGVRAIPLSVDLWVHVIDFYIKHYTAEDGGKDKVRTIFERAVRAAGEEFRSEKLWNKYIQWEIENKRMIAVIGLYDRVLQTETQHYSIFFNDFSDLVNAHSPSELMSFTDFEQVLQQARDTLASDAAKKPIEKAAEKKPADGEKTDEKEDEDEEMDDAPPGVEDHEKPPNEEELKHIRVQMIKERKKLFDVTEQAVTKVWAFEEGIKRPYFHVKQLERAQLKNWREYLDSEIARGEHNRIVLLFERCLIACALYEDFWMKFAKYMITHDAEKARGIYKRACDIHLPKKANIHIQWAAFEELQGNSEEASKILEQLDNSVPGMAMIKMRRVAVSRRAGDLQTAESLLRTFVAAAAKDKEELFYSRKLAWFLFKMTDKTDEARKLLRDLIPKYRSESKLYNDLVEMEFHSAGVHLDELEEQQAVDAFDLALACDKLSDEQKFSFSQKKLEFLEDFGRDVKRLQKTYDEHQKLVKNQKKQRAQDVSEPSSQPPAKKSKNEPAVSVPVIPPPVSVTPVVANGNRYGGATATTPAGGYPAGMHHHPPQPHPHHPHPVPNPAFGAAGGDPHHQQYYQQQNYWNFQQQKANEQAHYGYNQQWNQYYGQR